MDEFIGAQLLSVTVDPGREMFELVTSRGTLRAQSEGDCCSHSWFESVDIDGIGGVITKFEETGGVEVPSADHECLQTYFGTVYTTTGRLCYELRNSSNGYYGGSVFWSEVGQ